MKQGASIYAQSVAISTLQAVHIRVVRISDNTNANTYAKEIICRHTTTGKPA